MAIITVVEIVPGKRAEFEAFIKKDVVPAMQKAQVRGYHVMEVVYGENTGGYITAVGDGLVRSDRQGAPVRDRAG